jgi:hypothetical protein
MAITIPSFQRRGLRPSAEGRMGDPEAIGRLPKLTPSTILPGTVGKQISNIGRIIFEKGEAMKLRQDTMKVAQLFNDAQVDAARFEGNLVDEDFPKWADSVEKHYDLLTKHVMRKGRDAGLGSKALATLQLNLESGKTTAIVEAIRRAGRVEGPVTIKQLDLLLNHMLKTVTDHGLGSTEGKLALIRYQQAVDASVDILGETIVASRKLDANRKAEEQSFTTHIMEDPKSFIDMYGPGGEHTPRHTIKIDKFLVRARERLNAIERGLVEDNRLATLLQQRTNDTFRADVEAALPEEMNEANERGIRAWASARVQIQEILGDSIGTSTEEKTRLWAAKQFASIDATRDLLHAKTKIATAQLDEIQGHVDVYRKGITEAFERSSSPVDIPAAIPSAGDATSVELGEIFRKEIQTYNNEYAISAEKQFNALVLFAKDRTEQINNDHRVAWLFGGHGVGLQNSEDVKIMNDAFWDLVASEELLRLTGSEETPTTKKQWVFDNFFDPDSPSLPGHGVSLVWSVYRQTGLVMDGFVDYIEGHLRNQDKGAADVIRANVIRVAHQFSLDNPSVFDTFSPELKSAVEHFRISGREANEVFGASQRRKLSRATLDVEATNKVNALADGLNVTEMVGDYLPNTLERLITEMRDVPEDATWAGHAFEFIGDIFKATDDPQKLEKQSTDKRPFIKKVLSALSGGLMFREDVSRSLADLSQTQVFNVQRIKDMIREDIRNELLGGSSDTLDEATDVVMKRAMFNINISSWGNQGNDMTIQYMSPTNDKWRLGTDDQVAMQFVRLVKEAMPEVLQKAGEIPFPTEQMFHDGTYKTIVSRRVQGRNGIPVWEVWHNDSPLMDKYGRVFLFQPEVNNTAAINALRRAKRGTWLGGKVNAVIEAVDRLTPVRRNDADEGAEDWPVTERGIH